MNVSNRINKGDFRRMFEISSGDNLIDWANPPEDFATSSEEIIKSLLDNIFISDVFDFAIVTTSRLGILNIFSKNRLPSFCLSQRLAKIHLTSFIGYALKGYTLIVSVICKFENISHVLTENNWKISDRNDLDILNEINANWQEEAISIGTKFCKGGMFLFCHDADPIYFLEK